MSIVRRLVPLAILAVVGALASTAGRAADDVRFTATLTPQQRVDTGLGDFSADNLAVIDGLVRQDEAASKLKHNGVDHTRFSQRRTPREREISGLAQLSAPELAQLDELVRKRIEPADTGWVATADPVDHALPTGVKPVAYKRPLELHGEMSYTMGWSKGGNFQGGDLVLTYDDPSHRFSVLVGYSEYHGKGLSPCFYPGGGPYRPFDVGPVSDWSR